MELMKQMKSKPKLTKSTSFISWRKPIAHISARVCTRNGFCVERTLPKPLLATLANILRIRWIFFRKCDYVQYPNWIWNPLSWNTLWDDILDSFLSTVFLFHWFLSQIETLNDYCSKLSIYSTYIFIRMKYFFHTKKNYTKKYFSIQKPVSVNLATWNALKTKYKNVKNNSFCFLNTYGFTVKISELIWNGWLWKKNSVN